MLKSAVAEKNPDDYVVAKKPTKSKPDDIKMLPETVEDAFSEALRERHGDTYLYNALHGLRKTFAQRYYDIIRERCEKKQTIAKTNAVLGHGYNRGPQGIKSYVKNMH
jgi:hypothetical protein